jgi:hypothetical protein
MASAFFQVNIFETISGVQCPLDSVGVVRSGKDITSPMCTFTAITPSMISHEKSLSFGRVAPSSSGILLGGTGVPGS